MNKTYKDSLDIEREGKKLVLEFLEKSNIRCKWLLGKDEQRKGDIFCENLGLYIELKVEQKKISENYFAETWSNKSRGALGWLHTITADCLFYLFLEEKCLHCMSVYDLKKAIKSNKYKEVVQKKYKQPNDTWGLLVPRNHVYTTKYNLC